jgi:predicted RNA-binding protein YlqC (UPF0109 family)
MADHGEAKAYRILLLIVQHLVDNPGAVDTEILLGEVATKFRVRACSRDASLLIGRGGRTARSIRAIVAAMGRQARWQYCFEIECEESDPNHPAG